jgi:hypothetical protein
MRDTVEAKLGPTVAALLDARDGCALLLIELPIALPAVQMTEADAQDVWHSCGLYYQFQGRLHEALAIYDQMYEQYLLYQDTTGRRVHKGGALLRVSECHLALRHPVLAKRYLMLTTCEDALIHDGEIPPETTGVYFRMMWQYGMPHHELARYAQTMWTLAQEHPEPSRFPEWVVQHVDQHWMTGYPSAEEAYLYPTSRGYVRWLLTRLGTGDGKALELLAEYLLSAMPGCRASRRQQSYSTDYDVVCTLEGLDLDFRSELGRYFVAECKDWSLPADVTAFAKFCRVLDSVKCHFGILFSREGISGTGKSEDAAREQLKVYQDRGMVVVVVTRDDLESVAAGENFITMLRSKYEQVRLDLRAP